MSRIRWAEDGSIMYRINNSGYRTGPYGYGSKRALDGATYPPYDSSDSYGLDGAEPYLLINFPQSVTINKVGITMTDLRPGDLLSYFVSSDSVSGAINDGTWVEVGSHYFTTATNSGTATTEMNTLQNPQSGTWLSMRNYGSNNAIVCLQLFGEYDNPTFELWDTEPTPAILISDYPAALNEAPNHSDYSDYSSFKIKNVSGSDKSYLVKINFTSWATDTFINNYFTVGHLVIDNWTKVDGNTGYTTATVPNNTFSEELRVYADFTKAQNSANGMHYFSVIVEEV